MQDQAIPQDLPQKTGAGAFSAAPVLTTSTETFESSPAAVKNARDYVSRTLKAWGLTIRVDEIRLCVSELATNAFCHGTISGHRFMVKVSAGPGLVRIEVHDSSTRRPQLRTPDETDTSGRGLLLVSVLSDNWGVEERQPDGKVVWSEFTFDGSAKAIHGEPGGGSRREI
jgi:anti-sigma regulatory factor (Ser/Thr protein kinase)